MVNICYILSGVETSGESSSGNWPSALASEPAARQWEGLLQPRHGHHGRGMDLGVGILVQKSHRNCSWF